MRTTERALRSVLPFAGVAFLAAAGCGGGNTAASSVAVVRADLISQTVHAGTETPVSVPVAPSSTCALRGLSNGDQTVYSDMRGVVTFSTTLSNVGDAVDLSLACYSAATAPTLHPISLRAVPDTQPTSAPTAWLQDLPYPGRLIAPLAEDPQGVTAERLAELGLPPKPDRVAAPAAYAAWLDRVSRPSTLVEGQPTVDTGAAMNTISPNDGSTQSSWAGYITTSYSGLSANPFGGARGRWIVPSVTTPIPRHTGNWFSSTWAGVGGHVDTQADVAFPQAGSTQQVGCGTNNVGILACNAFYYAWVEYYPANSQAVVNIAPGDQITATTYFVDGSGNFNPAAETAKLVVERKAASTGAVTTFTVVLNPTPSKNTPTVPTHPKKDSVEWIVERPAGTTALAKFPDLTITATLGDLNAPPTTFGPADPNAATDQMFMQMPNPNPFVPGLDTLATVSLPAADGSFVVHWVADQ